MMNEEERIHAEKMIDIAEEATAPHRAHRMIRLLKDTLILIEETSTDETSRSYARDALEKLKQF
jgi:hypothetical protein